MAIRNVWTGLVVAVGVTAAGSTWAAEPAKFEESIKYRRAAMTMLKWHADRIAPMVKKPQAFKRDEVARNAAYIEFLSRVCLDGFEPGSDQGDTKALPEIWKDWNRFKSLGERFQAEAAKLRDVAKNGDAAAVKAQFGETNKVCKACHEDFKSSKLTP
ncbi:MAG TPA: cytochrome c [Rhodocyclaceae bacterium]|nr:cytochrome c [Rhodocyclaceae bacterium]